MSLSPSSAAASSSSGPPDVISAPDEVQAGVALEATITTVGLSTCWRADGADTQVSGNLAVVVPYDLSPKSEDICGDAIVHLPRTVKLTFATLRVNGRKVAGRDTSAASSTVVEKQILVR